MEIDDSKFDSINYTPATKDLKVKDIGYCCSDCPSLIEILSINENNFNINQKKIKNFKKNFQINFDTCEEHNEKYKSYCLYCNTHLCEKCQKFGIHIGHYKINIIEIEPTPEELKIIENIID